MTDANLPPWVYWVVAAIVFATLWSCSRVVDRLLKGRPALPRRGQRRPPWGLDGGVLAGLFLLGAAMASLGSEPSDGAVTADDLGFALAAAQGFTLLVFATVAVGWLVVTHASSGVTRADFGLPDSARQAVLDLGVGVLACAVMLPVVYAVNAALVLTLGEPTPHPAIRSLLDDPSGEVIAAAGMLAVVVAPLFEELAFRVLLQGGLQRFARRTAWWPIFVSSLAFGMAHTNQGFAPAPIFVLALGLGYVYRQTHSYPAVVAMHMAFNALSLTAAVAAGQAGVEL